jgi:hypothetical protein
MNMLSIRSYVAMVLLAALGGCAGAADDIGEEAEIDATAQALSRAPEVPDILKVPEGNRYAFLMDASGVQIYACRTSATAPSGYAWTFVAPEADLYKANGRPGGIHYGGPTWEYLDGSTVVAARVSGHTDDPASIPWLLLSSVSHTGDGKMSNVSYIQRLETSGGIAPSTGCDADHLGDEARIDYTATYYFYVPRNCGH